MLYITKAFLDHDKFIIKCEGELYRAFKDIFEFMHKELDALPNTIIFDLKNQTYLDSTAVVRLIKIQSLIQSSEHKCMKLYVTPQIDEILRLSPLDYIFDYEVFYAS